ncbi:hypothetical protein ABC347_04740 [Sphingomonas sp. 1P06PA]|uniref:hypothetical protein n=1 Tax=Sphingomonas sp. 1P06PA TaxID=554121 RepID=UPI0039A44FE6
MAPPFDLPAGMITIRVHLDDVPPSNAPLLIALGSHRHPVAEPAIAQSVAARTIHRCTARSGDAWLYATPILHASARADYPTRRRVLQIDFAAEPLPPPLQWLGI